MPPYPRPPEPMLPGPVLPEPVLLEPMLPVPVPGLGSVPEPCRARSLVVTPPEEAPPIEPGPGDAGSAAPTPLGTIGLLGSRSLVAVLPGEDVPIIDPLLACARIMLDGPDASALLRSEERSVGKECVSTCRSQWSPLS